MDNLYVGDDYYEATQYLKGCGYQKTISDDWVKKISANQKKVAVLIRGMGGKYFVQYNIVWG